jgi:membrane protein DedA with SNARE-associated domain
VTLTELLSTYGYAIVFLVVAAESLGLPLPGETILALAAVSAGTHQMSIAGVIAAAAAGAVIGDNVGYWIGRWGGYRLLRRYGHYIRVDERRLLIGRYLADRHGGKVVLFGRFVSILRTYAALLAGTTQMGWRRFLVFNAAGGVLWAATYGVAFAYFGSAVTSLQPSVAVAAGAVALIAFVTGLVVVRRKGRELGEAAARAYSDAVVIGPTGRQGRLEAVTRLPRPRGSAAAPSSITPAPPRPRR